MLLQRGAVGRVMGVQVINQLDDESNSDNLSLVLMGCTVIANQFGAITCNDFTMKFHFLSMAIQ